MSCEKIERHAPKTPQQVAAVEKFKAFCLSSTLDDKSDELDWYALSIGFFLALGLTEDEAFELALHVRYDKGYWA